MATGVSLLSHRVSVLDRSRPDTPKPRSRTFVLAESGPRRVSGHHDVEAEASLNAVTAAPLQVPVPVSTRTVRQFAYWANGELLLLRPSKD